MIHRSISFSSLGSMEGDQGATVNHVNWDSDDDNEPFTPRSRPRGWNPGKPRPPPRFVGGINTDILPEEYDFPSTIKDEHIPWIRDVYGIPKSVKLCPPNPWQRVHCKWETSKAVCFYNLWFEIGLRLPLPWFLREVLSHFGVAPSQLMPNALRVILGLQTISETRGIRISIDTLLHAYSVKEHDKEKGRIVLVLRSGYQPLVITPSTSVDVSWKKEYFFVKTNYVFGSDRSLNVPVHWQPFERLGKRGRSESEIDFGERSAEEILKLPYQERRSATLLKPRVLENTSIWWTAIMESGGCAESYSEMVGESLNIRYADDMLERVKQNRRKRKLLDSQKQIVTNANDTVIKESPMTRQKSEKKNESFPSGSEVFTTTIELGQDATVNVGGSSYFESKKFDLDKTIISQGGLRGVASYALGENLKALHGSIFVVEQVVALEDECDSLKKEVDHLKKLVSEAEARVTDARSKQEMAEKSWKSAIHEGEKRVIETRRSIFKDLVGGTAFDYDEEIICCDEFLAGLEQKGKVNEAHADNGISNGSQS